MMKKKISGILLAVAVAGLVLAGCGGGGETKEPSGTPAGASSQIAVVGSTSVAPVAEELRNAFEAKNSNVKVNIQAVGSGAGIKAATDGSAQIGMSSRELKNEEKSGISEYIIAYDGIAVVVNPKNKAADLTKDQVAAIFKGEVTNWKEVGGDDAGIIVISREEGSGTRGAFEELLKLQKTENDVTISLLSPDAQVANSTGAVKSGVATKANAIGYISLSGVDNTVKALKISGVEPSSATVKDSSYSIARPFILLTKGEATGDAKAFIDFILSGEGQEIVSETLVTVH